MKHDPNQKTENWIGKRCSFNAELGGPMAGGKILVGLVESANYIGQTERGKIHNYLLKVRGASGKVADVNFVEQYAQISE